MTLPDWVHHKTIKNRVGRVLLEKDIETYWKKRCAEIGWMSEKFSSMQKASVPDQVITIPAFDDPDFPSGFVFFCELKAPGKTATDKQQSDHKTRRMYGCIVVVCDSYEEVDLAIDYINERLTETLTFSRQPQCLLM